MEKILSYDNVALIVCALWIVELKRQVAAKDAYIRTLTVVIQKFYMPIERICELLKLKVEVNGLSESIIQSTND